MPPIELVKTPPKQLDALIVGARDTGDGLAVVGLPDALTKTFGKGFGGPQAYAAAMGVTGKLGETTALSGDGVRVVVVGLGDAEPDPYDLRRAAGAGVRAAAKLAGSDPLDVAVSLDATEPELLRAAAEGALLGAYGFAGIRSEEQPAKIARISLVGPARAAGTEAVREGAVIAEAVARARDWVNLPANLLYPETFAAQAKELAKGTKLGVEVLDDKQLAAGGYGGLTAVGGGSSRGPRLIRVTWAPRGAKAHLALVGKGITFDSGGLDIKPPDAMYTMKCDMAGAAAVLAAVRAIADLGLKIKVTAYAACAENLPSATAYRPSDVLTMYGGKTVENGNTDAEGRLVMADALARATEDSPDALVDVATLTGAAMIALGDSVAAVLSPDEELVDAVMDAADAAGELFWPLPITEEARDKLTSQVADVKSTGDRAGGALTAAAFLEHFVADVPWAHLDIAGPAFVGGKSPDTHIGPGGTGAAVATLVELARGLAR
nr:leucyl aminopeptidase [Naumannella cuiyingiana]